MKRAAFVNAIGILLVIVFWLQLASAAGKMSETFVYNWKSGWEQGLYAGNDR